ncbi:hypothetical protein BS78_03G100800 [Paspalum vaginatum]|nr:hypothetical protein BS78_03G100800 [Paspalum vaginatum]
MAARSAAAATAACHALRRALRVDELLAQASTRLRSSYRRRFLGGSSSTPAAAAVGAVVLCAAAAFPRAAAFFLPLVASTSLCCAAAWLFAAEAAKEEGVEVVRVGGGGGRGKVAPEPGLLQVIGDANASAYGAAAGGGVQVGCFLRRPARCGVDEDGDEVVFAGTLAPRCAAGGGGQASGALLETMVEEEELAAMRVDSLAQGVWDSYFGGWSRWHDAYAAY